MYIYRENKLNILLMGAQPSRLAVTGVFLGFKCAFLEDRLSLSLKEFWIAESYFFGHFFVTVNNHLFAKNTAYIYWYSIICHRFSRG